jgi:hypothetical protein
VLTKDERGQSRSGRLEDATDHQNNVAKEPYPRGVRLDLGNVREPQDYRDDDQNYRKPERPLGWCMQIHDIISPDNGYSSHENSIAWMEMANRQQSK